MVEVGEIVGTTIDWDGFESAKDTRWKYIGLHHYHCTLHDTHFDPDGYDENDCMDAEPCWDCFNEFERII